MAWGAAEESDLGRRRHLPAGWDEGDIRDPGARAPRAAPLAVPRRGVGLYGEIQFELRELPGDLRRRCDAARHEMQKTPVLNSQQRNGYIVLHAVV